MFCHIQDGGEARHETVDERGDALRVASQAGESLQRLGAFVDRQLVLTTDHTYRRHAIDLPISLSLFGRQRFVCLSFCLRS